MRRKFFLKKFALLKFFRNFVGNNLKRLYKTYMEQYISQDEIRRIIITDMVKKRNSIVPVIGEDTWKRRVRLTSDGNNVNLVLPLSCIAVAVRRIHDTEIVDAAQ